MLLILSVLSDFLHRQSSHLQPKAVLFLPSICIHFIVISCLIALASTSKTMLKRRGYRTHSCFSSDLNEKDLSFSPLSRILAIRGFFRYSLSTSWRISLLITVYWVFFTMNKYWVLLILFLYLLLWSCFFSFSTCWCDRLHKSILNDEPVYYTGYKSYLAMVYHIFIHCCIQFAIFFLKILA